MPKSNEIKTKILRIMDVFDMGAKGGAKAMGVTPQTFRMKKSDKVDHHSFNLKNLQDLIDYIKKEADKL